MRALEPALFAVAAAVIAWQALGCSGTTGRRAADPARRAPAMPRGRFTGTGRPRRSPSSGRTRGRASSALEDGRTLFLAGQLFYELEEERKFPCREFEVDWTPRSGWRLDLRCIGEYLPPSADRAAFPKEAQKQRLTPSNGAVFEGDFQAMKDPSWPMVSTRPVVRAS